VTARSSASHAGGLDHLFNLGKNPLAPFRGTATDTNILGDEKMSQSEDQSDAHELNRQAVEQELQRYESDGLQATAAPCERVFSSSKETSAMQSLAPTQSPSTARASSRPGARARFMRHPHPTPVIVFRTVIIYCI